LDKIKLLLDTDIGSDIDDAVALAYLLSQPRCELLGITTVSGEAEKRAMIASAICKAAGTEVPIYPGVSEPLLVPQIQPRAPQARMLFDWEHNSNFPKNQAIRFLQKTIRDNPGEITLLTIGPLTNIGLLFAVDRELPHLLKSIILMSGAFLNDRPIATLAEWNTKADPHAAAIVYNSPVALHRSFGLDVTKRVTMKADEVKRRFNRGLLSTVLDFAKVWFEKANMITYHDPLSAVCIFEEDICTYQKGSIEIELKSDWCVGTTHWQADSHGRHEIADSVDADAFFHQFFSVFEKQD
jgi:inosine-uridine nucleoside N-ribohydrolase